MGKAPKSKFQKTGLDLRDLILEGRLLGLKPPVLIKECPQLLIFPLLPSLLLLSVGHASFGVALRDPAASFTCYFGVLVFCLSEGMSGSQTRRQNITLTVSFGKTHPPLVGYPRTLCLGAWLSCRQDRSLLDDTPVPRWRRWCRNRGNLHHNVSVCVPDGKHERSIGSWEVEVSLGRGWRHVVVVDVGVQGPSSVD